MTGSRARSYIEGVRELAACKREGDLTIVEIARGHSKGVCLFAPVPLQVMSRLALGGPGRNIVVSEYRVGK